jgi:hypothetical protein
MVQDLTSFAQLLRANPIPASLGELYAEAVKESD